MKSPSTLRVSLLILSILLSLTPIESLFYTAPNAISTVSAQPSDYNVILMIGDGMSLEQIRAGSLVETGNDTGLFMQNPEFYQGLMTTNNIDGEITDSAAAATALATGYKTWNGYLGKLPDETDVQTILEFSESQGRDTALVTTTEYFHATPAAFASHQISRHNSIEIVDQMLSKDIELILGGGSRLLPPAGYLEDQSYKLIQTKNELTALSGKTLGVFEQAHLQYEKEVDLESDVRLHQIVNSTLKFLDASESFFLMIESGRIDHAGHNNDQVGIALEIIEFNRSIKMVYQWVQDNPDTLVIITADHETGGFVVEATDNLGTNLPSGNDSEVREIRINRAESLQTSFSTTSHTDTKVPIFAFGYQVDNLFNKSEYDNIDIYPIMKAVLSDKPLSAVPSISDTKVIYEYIKIAVLVSWIGIFVVLSITLKNKNKQNNKE